MKNLLIYPSATTWITPRSEDVQLTTNNMLLIMPKPIADLETVLLSTNGLRITQVTISSSQAYANVALSEIKDSNGKFLTALDISKYFVEKNKWNTLKVRTALEPITAENVKNNSSYYVRNDTNIKIRGAKETYFEPPIYEAVDEALKALFKSGTFYFGSQQIASWGTLNRNTSSSLLKWQYRVSFTPLGETTRLNTLKSIPLKTQYAIPFSQQQQIVSSVGLGRNMQSAADRTGAETRQVVRRIRSVSELRKLGSTTSDGYGIWRLTDMALTATNDRLIVTETWSKNWSVRSQFVGVNREFRSWNIPSDITQRNLLWQDYLLISRLVQLDDDDDVLISDSAKDVLANFITGTTYSGNAEITGMWMLNSAGNGAVCTVSAFGFGNSLVFSAKTQDNLSTGIRRAQIADGDADWRQCVDVYYCKDDGEFENNTVKITMGADITNMNADVYPEVTRASSTLTINGPDTTQMLLFQDKSFTVYKDPAEQINFTYQLHMMTDDPALIIGTAFAARNPLVTNNKTQLKYWELTKKLPQGAQTMSTYYGREVSDNVVTLQATRRLVFARRSGSDVVGVCVTDTDNNILIARNSNSLLLRTYYMNFTHNYKLLTGG